MSRQRDLARVYVPRGADSADGSSYGQIAWALGAPYGAQVGWSHAALLGCAAVAAGRAADGSIAGGGYAAASAAGGSILHRRRARGYGALRVEIPPQEVHHG